MNNNLAPPGAAQLPPVQSLIRPEQVGRVSHFNEQQKAQYTKGISQLHETLRNSKDRQESPEYQNAWRKLADVTTQIRAGMKKYLDGQTAQQNGGRPTSQGYPAQPNTAGEQKGPGQQSSGQTQASEQYSEQVIQVVRSLNVIPPPQLQGQGQDKIATHIREWKQKYAQNLQRLESATSKLHDLGRREREGKTLSPEETQSLRMVYQKQIQECREFIERFRKQQETLRNQLNHNSNTAGQGGSRLGEPPLSNPQSGGSGAAIPGSQRSQQSSLSGQQPSDATAHIGRIQVPISGQTSMGPSGNISQLPTNQGSTTQTTNSASISSEQQQRHIQHQLQLQLQQQQQQQQQQQLPPQQTTSPQNMTSSDATSGLPYPLTHQDAMAQAARSYSQANIGQSTPQSSSVHGHPGTREPQNNSIKMPIPKSLNVPQPQPVPMGSARPTLSGGPSNAGMLTGQPGLQKYPGYVLQGEGEHVLGKKKLEELVRQVTGGAEGETGDGLTPEVEEVMLEVADNFVDQVIVAACRLAKLRQSSTLEIRDVQLVLERNYNIRVPGFASDELRTVKKIQPAPGWAAKMAAISASKLTSNSQQ